MTKYFPRLLQGCFSVIGLAFFNFFILAYFSYGQCLKAHSLANNLAVSLAPIVEKACPAVVDLYVLQVNDIQLANPFFNDPFFEFLFGDFSKKGSTLKANQSSGSGVIMTEQGLLVTCAHVVQDATAVVARLIDGREFKAEILKIDRTQDLAILQMKGLEGKRVPYLPIGNSENLKVGDQVLAIGNSFGLGQTVTGGIISALSRPFKGRLLIQTDAAINPGNSGGALIRWLVNSDNTPTPELIGIPNAIFSKSGASHGVGFAIPSALVENMLKTLNPGYVAPWIGVYVQTLTPELVANLQERGFKGSQGVIVTDLHSQSPAYQAGLKVGDVITSMNDKPLTCEEDFEYRLNLLQVSDKLNISIWRQGDEKRVLLQVVKAPFTPKAEETTLDSPQALKGIKVANMSPALARQYDLDERKAGVVIIEPQPQNQNLLSVFLFEKGDYITSINHQKIKSVEDLKTVLKQPREGMIISIDRGGQQLILRAG